jgi:predicted RNA binding protein YcfA (HicA-like mRNA interferase family)
MHDFGDTYFAHRIWCAETDIKFTTIGEVDIVSILIYHYKYIFLVLSRIITMTGKEVIKLLESNGWKVLRTNGSHFRLGKDGLRTTVPVHGKRELGKGLLATIEKQTGVKLK